MKLLVQNPECQNTLFYQPSQEYEKAYSFTYLFDSYLPE